MRKVKCKATTNAGKVCSKMAHNNGFCYWHQSQDPQKDIPKCQAVTKKGEPCKGKIVLEGHCRQHCPYYECPVCTCQIYEKELSCGHRVHRNCIIKSSNSLQQIRNETGHPPLTFCQCPVCRVDIPDLPVPRSLRLSQRGEGMDSMIEYLTRIMNESSTFEGERTIQMYILM